MQWKVLLFASLKDDVGSPSITLEACGPLTARQLLERLEERHPQLCGRLGHVRVAVNQQFQEPEARLPEGAEIALIPPVSGG